MVFLFHVPLKEYGIDYRIIVSELRRVFWIFGMGSLGGAGDAYSTESFQWGDTSNQDGKYGGWQRKNDKSAILHITWHFTRALNDLATQVFR